ncbi:chorion peroxidase [Scaptodrosophila lebanonensis]|uniref:Chorion peroxidase n=1 Tax=Drosophila lebanonensis TaxID=7225 RepID=A0A6J2T5V3_DROLE|nr:chorion peroxidase [Scaptodrosophila lebanonensis]
MWRNLIVFIVIVTLTNALHDFPQSSLVLSKDVKSYLNGISATEWKEFADSGIDAVDRQKRLEKSLLSSGITVQNGSLSHIQLLDSLPSQDSKRDSEIALKILRSSLFVYNAKCVPNGIENDECRTFLEIKSVPSSSELWSECQRIVKGQRDGHRPFRRLMAPHYKNGLQEMFPEDRLPEPWPVSMALYDRETRGTKSKQSSEEDTQNLSLVQWAQFVEHDLSKPVVTSMNDGWPIECCNPNQKNLLPRHHHPACAPILSKIANPKYGWRTCLNYVRSALAVGENCNFGAAQQLNQATGCLDLSQLYGFTTAAQEKMRTFSHGKLKSTTTMGTHLNDLLPMSTDANEHTFCTTSNASTCFMAGDSRVNRSPYSILAYTLFMRNHNRVAAELGSNNPSWSDEQLFQAAKSVNVDTYRHIITNEWLPVVLGTQLAAEVQSKTESPTPQEHLSEVYNEFGVAAIRFYFSMLPNVLHNNVNADADFNFVRTDILQILFALKEEIYKPRLQYTAGKLNDILQSLLHQRAMKMDASYVSDLVWHEAIGTKPTHADVLAFDIQRGRDHGLQPYFKYLEVCKNIKINNWKDFERFIPKDHVDKLKDIYESWEDVDLIVGGISERTNDGTVGPTFSCILAEQFSKTLQCQKHQHQQENPILQQSYGKINGSRFLCLNSMLTAVPQNIFRLPSERNPLIDCDDQV